MRILITLVTIVSLQGCVTAEGSFRDRAIKGAAFQLSCPEEKLSLTVIKRQEGLSCEGSEVGVSGCGRLVSVVYVCGEDGEWNLKRAPSPKP